MWELSAAIVVVVLVALGLLVWKSGSVERYKQRVRLRDAADKQTEKLEGDFQKFRGKLGRNVRRRLSKPKGDA